MLVNKYWIDIYPKSKAHFLAEDTSDHYPGLIIFYKLQHLGPKPFKYFDMWSTDLDFLKVIAATWKQRTQGSRMHQITLKLQKLQQPLKKPNREHFSEIQIKFNTAKENLSTLRL